MMRLATTGLIAALACAALMRAIPASAQLESREAISLQNQILELRHEMQQRGQAGGGDMAAPVAPPIGGAPSSRDQGAPDQGAPDAGAATALTPQLLNRVATLEEEVRTLRGQLDQLTNQVQQQSAALSKQIGDLGFAMQQSHPAAPPATAHEAAPTKPLHRRSAEEALRDGNAALAHGHASAAEADAREALANAHAQFQTDARFLLAQAYAGQHQYQKATTAYYDVYTHAPHSNRAGDALLGVSTSLLALGDKKDACQALQQLHASDIHPSPHVRKEAASVHARAGCR
ncbi:hypothetical protein [Lichenicoccus sp.]|uniref:hypothetical protein n=1 Tax=Lichenicoccus sp. TaxID=2781899 RepID=UPI003D0B1114